MTYEYSSDGYNHYYWLHDNAAIADDNYERHLRGCPACVAACENGAEITCTYAKDYAAGAAYWWRLVAEFEAAERQASA